MTLTSRTFVLGSTVIGLLLATTPALAERILRADEVAVGEIDPAKGTDYADTVLAINLYDTLVYPKQGGAGVQPHLATDWTVDDATYTFNLRDDVKFNSGNPLTAADVAYSFDRMMALAQGNSSLFAGVVESVKVTGDHTVVFALSKPFAPFLATLIRMPIVDMAVVKENEKDGDWASTWMSQNSAGSGPYVITSHDPQTETVLSYEADYFLDPVDSHPETVRFRYGLEAATVRALMGRGEHDISSQWLPPEVYAGLAEDGATLVTEAGLTGEYFKLNTQRAPLDDVHCRRALAYAFDYATMGQLTQINDNTATGTPMTGAIPQGLPGYDGSLPVFQQDMALAKEELGKCQYDPKDHPLDVVFIAETPARERGALMMQAIYSTLGFKVEITRTPWALLTEQVTAPATAPHVVEIAISAASPDTDSLLYAMYHSSQPPTWISSSYYKNADVDALLDKGRVESDQDARQAIYAEANAILAEEVPDIYAYELLSPFAVREGVTYHNLADPKRTYPVSGFNMRFADISVPE